MPPRAQNASIQTRGLRPGGDYAPEGDSPEGSAVRTFESLADKARAMCGHRESVTFFAIDWDLPRANADDTVEFGFLVHGNKRLRIRLARARAARLGEALTLALYPPVAVPFTPAPPPVDRRTFNRAPYKMTDAQVDAAMRAYARGEESIIALAAGLGVSTPGLCNRFIKRFGKHYVFRARDARREGASAIAALVASGGLPAPALKPNGAIL